MSVIGRAERCSLDVRNVQEIVLQSVDTFHLAGININRGG
jgi:hypothetical protein